MALDMIKLAKDAQARYDKMSTNPEHRGDPDLTYSSFVLNLVAEIESRIRAEAQSRLAAEPVASYSDKDKKRLLATKVNTGTFDA